jgi:hypothetical protein
MDLTRLTPSAGCLWLRARPCFAMPRSAVHSLSLSQWGGGEVRTYLASGLVDARHVYTRHEAD